MEFGQSLSQKSKIFDSSLYTLEPWAYGSRQPSHDDGNGNDTEQGKAVTNTKKALHALKNCPGENSGAALFMYRVGRSNIGKNYSAIFLNSS